MTKILKRLNTGFKSWWYDNQDNVTYPILIVLMGMGGLGIASLALFKPLIFFPIVFLVLFTWFIRSVWRRGDNE